MSVEARTVILERIRSASPHGSMGSAEGLRAEWDALPRDYLQVPRLDLEARLKLLEQRLRDYDAEVTRVDEADVASAIAAVLAARGNRPTLLPRGFPLSWTSPDAPFTVDDLLSTRQLDHFEGVVTGATVAIAETGSLVLRDVAGQGRRAATLVPDFHLCVVRAEDVVESVPEAFALLSAEATLPMTFISGPSATADIEMTRVKGVHGPRFLHVLLVTRSVG